MRELGQIHLALLIRVIRVIRGLLFGLRNRRCLLLLGRAGETGPMPLGLCP